MPNGILRALKVKPAKASDGQEFAATDNSNILAQRAPQKSTSLTLPEAHILSEVRKSCSLDSASYTARSPSNDVSNNSTTYRKDSFDVESKGKRQQRFRRAWFLGHRKIHSQLGTKGVAPRDDRCSLEVSGTPQRLLPMPNNLGSQGRTETLSTNHKECQLANKFALEKTTGNQNSAARIMVASLKFPMDFALHVAKGFHNAPKIYGDDTVRPFRKIKGLKTGLESSARVTRSLHIYASANSSRNLLSVSTTVFQESSPSLSEARRGMVLLDSCKV